MPLYEYRCAQCGKVFEVIQKFSDEPLTVHEACGGTVERLISKSAFHLKGGGWYASGYSSPAPSNGEAKAGDGEKKSDAPAKTETKSGESKTSESKPAETKSTETKSADSGTSSSSSSASTTKSDT